MWRQTDALILLRAINRSYAAEHGGEPLEAGTVVSLNSARVYSGFYIFPRSFEAAVHYLEELGALEQTESGSDAFRVTARALEMLREENEPPG